MNILNNHIYIYIYTTIKDFYNKNHGLIGQFIKFILTGGFTFIIDLGLLLGLIWD